MIVCVITPEMESVGSVADALRTFGDATYYWVIENHRHNEDAEDFGWWHGFTDLAGRKRGGKSKSAVERLISKHRAVVTMMPALKPSTVRLLNVNELSFSEALSHSGIGRADKLRIQLWLQHIAGAMDTAGVISDTTPTSKTSAASVSA